MLVVKFEQGEVVAAHDGAGELLDGHIVVAPIARPVVAFGLPCKCAEFSQAFRIVTKSYQLCRMFLDSLRQAAPKTSTSCFLSIRAICSYLEQPSEVEQNDMKQRLSLVAMSMSQEEQPRSPVY